MIVIPYWMYVVEILFLMFIYIKYTSVMRTTNTNTKSRFKELLKVHIWRQVRQRHILECIMTRYQNEKSITTL